MPAVPAYTEVKKELRRRAAGLGFEGPGGRWARRTSDTWEVLRIFPPPRAQVEPRVVRFDIRVEVSLCLELRYYRRIDRSEDSGPPRDSLRSFFRVINPSPDLRRRSCHFGADAPTDTLWTASETTDPMSLADRIWAEFERTGLPFLEELASATAIRDFLLPGLDEPPSSHYWIIRLALLCKAIGPQEAYERAMALLEHFPGPATYRSHARDHWHMIQRFEP